MTNANIGQLPTIVEQSSTLSERIKKTKPWESPRVGRPRGRAVSEKALRRRRDKKMLMLAQNGLTQEQIAVATGVSLNTVKARLKPFANVFKELKNVEKYRAGKLDILAAAELAVLKNGITDEKLQKASLYASMQAFDILHKAGRLEAGKSTENIETHFTKITMNRGEK